MLSINKVQGILSGSTLTEAYDAFKRASSTSLTKGASIPTVVKRDHDQRRIEAKNSYARESFRQVGKR